MSTRGSSSDAFVGIAIAAVVLLAVVYFAIARFFLHYGHWIGGVVVLASAACIIRKYHEPGSDSFNKVEISTYLIAISLCFMFITSGGQPTAEEVKKGAMPTGNVLMIFNPLQRCSEGNGKICLRDPSPFAGVMKHETYVGTIHDIQRRIEERKEQSWLYSIAFWLPSNACDMVTDLDADSCTFHSSYLSSFGL